MALQNLLPFVFFFLYSTLGIAQVNFLKGENWEEAKALSESADKPIFIDFYTTWCGPCKVMDKYVFTDSTIIALLNENFINLKLDAEKSINKDLVKQYEINAYPTSIFIDHQGDLIAKEVGYKSTDEFESLCINLLTFKEEDHATKLTVEKINKISVEELDTILSKYLHYNFNEKAAIKRKYYDLLKLGEQISFYAVQYLLINYEKEDEYFLLLDMIPEKISFDDYIEWSHKFRRFFEGQFKDATEQGDLIAFNEISKYYLILSEKLEKSFSFSTQKDPSKEIRTKKLSFYLKNKHLEDYYILADSLINEYIYPHSVEIIRRGDQLSFKMSEFKFNPFGEEEKELLEEEKEEDLSLRDSLDIKHSTAFNFVSRLNEISENVILHIPHKEKLEKTLEWMDRSIEYLDLPESHIIKAATLKLLGREEQSQSEMLKAKASPYYDEYCISKVALLKL